MLIEIIVASSVFISENPQKSLLILLLGLAIYYTIVYPLFLSPLRNVPGPYLYRITKFFALNGQRNQTWIDTVYNLHKKYGNVVLISPDEVSVDGDFKYIQDLYVRNFPKLKFYENFRNHGFRDNMFSSLENDRHLKYKKVLMQLYQKTAIFSPNNSTRGMLKEKIEQLVNQVYVSSVTGSKPDFINAKSEHNEFGKGHRLKDNGKWFDSTSSTKNLGIDVYSLFGLLAMDVVLAFELGNENGTDLLLHPEDRHIIVSHRLQAGMGFWTTLMPKYWNWAATKEIIQASVTIEEWQLDLYDKAEKNVPKLGKQKSNLTSLETLKKNGFYGKDAYSFLSDNIFAGHETTAIQLAYLTYELSRPCNKNFQEKLINELRDVFGKKEKEGIVIIDDLEAVDNLKYLEALFQENLRLHTSIPGAEPRVNDRDYQVTERLVIPRGTTISCQPYSIHRKEKVFPNCDYFVPDRWLQYPEESDYSYRERMVVQQRYMMPFGKGIRMCLGMNLAMIEMKLAIANLYYNFNSKISPDWCEITESTSEKSELGKPIKLGEWNQGKNGTDEEMMVMVDAYTTRPLNDELWLRWYDNALS